MKAEHEEASALRAEMAATERLIDEARGLLGCVLGEGLVAGVRRVLAERDALRARVEGNRAPSQGVEVQAGLALSPLVDDQIAADMLRVALAQRLGSNDYAACKRLRALSLARLIEANENRKARNATADKGSGAFRLLVTLDDRVIAALFVALHYEAETPPDVSPIVWVDDLGDAGADAMLCLVKQERPQPADVAP